jgi:peptidoglycan/LPS O-acetylase OafA/YrhL
MGNPSQSKIRRIEFLDFAKGFSILTIVFYHYLSTSATGLMSKAVMLGGTGAHMFIILSGFGLTLSSYSFSPLPFYKRRFYKILLPYYLFVTLLFGVNQLYPFFPNSGIYAYLGHIFAYKMFDNSIVGSYGSHLWFISVIIQFYLAFPYLLRIKSRLGNKYFVILASLLSMLYWVGIILCDLTQLRVFNSFFLQYLWEFCIAMVLADHYRKTNYVFWDQKISTLLLATVTGIGLMGVIATYGGTVGRILNDIPAVVGYASLVALAYAIAKKSKPVVIIFTYIGSISYELYLSHVFVGMVISKILFDHVNINLSYLQSLFVLPFAIISAIYFRKFSQKVIQSLSRGKIWINLSLSKR